MLLREMVQRIDANTEDVVENVEGAQRELMKYWSRVSGNRWLVAKMFGVLMVLVVHFPLNHRTLISRRFSSSYGFLLLDETFVQLSKHSARRWTWYGSPCIRIRKRFGLYDSILFTAEQDLSLLHHNSFRQGHVFLYTRSPLVMIKCILWTSISLLHIFL